MHTENRTRSRQAPRPVPARQPTLSLRSRSMSFGVQRSDASKQIEPDTASGVLGSKVPITPPFPLAILAQVFNQSNMLRQCVAAYVTNIAMTGWEIVAADINTAMDEDEVAVLQSFIDSPNSEESLRTIGSKVVHNYEHYGHSYVEVIRDSSGTPSILRHALSRNMEICPKDETEVPVRYDITRGKRVSRVLEYRRFRIYRQTESGVVRYFKEMGDPRKLNCDTGEFESPTKKVPRDKEATELIHFRQLSDDAYGVPRWISQLPSILGSREAEEVNLQYFKDNTVPPMILSVTGGRLTGQSYRELKELLDKRGVGKERQNQILLLEAVAERESLDDSAPTVNLKVDKLTDSRPSDSLFQGYDEANQAKVRSSFRVPPVAVGLSQDVTFATANVATFVAETQVYSPARAYFDEVWNKSFVQNQQGLGLVTVALRSKAPVVTNPEILIRSLTALNVMGAVTPRIARDAANSILQINMPPLPEKGGEGYAPWMDEPIIFSSKTGSGNEGIDPAQAKTHNGQSQKDAGVKDVEDTGDVTPPMPEHGNE